MTHLESQAKEIFWAALDEGGDVEAFIKRACGDDAGLHQRVVELLEAHRVAGEFLGGQNIEATIDRGGSEPVPATASGMAEPTDFSRIGTYKLLEKIGEGGMGTVWVAEQSEPIKRKVAIKLIKAGMDSKAVLARFEAERKALAMMDHPNIASVLDGGLTEQGRPYFAMEYVKGVPFTDYCDQAKLSLKDRLNLFVTICNAHTLEQQQRLRKSASTLSWSPQADEDLLAIVWNDDQHPPRETQDGVADESNPSGGSAHRDRSRKTLEIWRPAAESPSVHRSIPSRRVVWSPNGKWLCWIADGELMIFDHGGSSKEFASHTESGMFGTPVFSPDGAKLVCRVNATDSLLFDVNRNGVLSVPEALKGTAPVFSPDSKWVAVGPGDTPTYSGHPITVYNVHKTEENFKLVGHTNIGERKTWSPNGKYLASASRDRTLRIWAIEAEHTAKQVAKYQLPSTVLSIDWDPSGHLLAVGSDRVEVFAPKLNEVEGIPNTRFFSIHPEGRIVALAGLGRPSVQLWDLKTMQDGHSLYAADREIRQVVYSPDGSLLAAVVGDGTRVVVWDTRTTRMIFDKVGDWGPTGPSLQSWHGTRLAWGPQSKKLAVAGNDDLKLHVYSVRRNDEIDTIDLRPVPSSSPIVRAGRQDLAWSKIGDKLISTAGTHIAELLDLTTDDRKIIQGHDEWEPQLSWTTDVAWRPNHDQFATTSLVGTVCIWDAQTAKTIRTLRRHQAPATDVVWSPDGDRIATCDLHGYAKIWDPLTGHEMLGIRLGERGIYSMQWSPDGMRLYASIDGNDYLSVIDASASHFRHRTPQAFKVLQDRPVNVPDSITQMQRIEFKCLYKAYPKQELARVLAKGVNEMDVFQYESRLRLSAWKCVAAAQAESRSSNERQAAWEQLQQLAKSQVLALRDEQVSSSSLQAMAYLDQLAFNVGRPKFAAECLSIYQRFEKDPDPVYLQLAGLAEMRQGHYFKAQEYLTKSLELYDEVDRDHASNALQKLARMISYGHSERHGTAGKIYADILLPSFPVDDCPLARDGVPSPTPDHFAGMARYLAWYFAPVQPRTKLYIAMVEFRRGNVESGASMLDEAESELRHAPVIDTVTLFALAEASIAASEARGTSR